MRYGKKTACYTKVIFASNTAFENIYAELRNGNEDEKRKYMALMRRIQNVYDFNNPEHRQKFLDDIPTGNPFYKLKPQQNVNYEMRLLSPEECKDMPW